MASAQKTGNNAAAARNGDATASVPAHETTERIPQLSSAPPSGNNPLSKPPNPGSPSSFVLPPPPPPPLRTTAAATAAPIAPPPPTGALGSTGFALPPPPRVTTTTRSTRARSTPSSSPSRPEAGRSPPSAPPPARPPPPPPPPLVPANRQQQQQPVRQEPTQQQQQQTAQAEPVPQAQEPVPIPSPQATTTTAGPPSFLPVTAFSKSWTPKNKSEQQQQRLRSILARRQTHVPVLVIATEAANRMAWKNGLQISDLFQGVVEDIHPSLQTMTPFRSVNRSLFLKDVRVRFLSSSQLESPFSYEETQEMMEEQLKPREEDGNIDEDLTLLEDRIDELLQHPQPNSSNHQSTNSVFGDDGTQQGESLEDVTKEAFRLTSPLNSMPWLARYRKVLDRSTDSLPHDLINCPPLVLLVCTATKEVTDPEHVLQELYQSNHLLPEVYKRGLYDPSTIRQEVLVLHDNHDDSDAAFDEKRLRQLLRSRFGPNSYILRINSSSPETAAALAQQESSDLWGGGGRLGTFLSDNDRVLLRRYFQSMLTTAILPSLERRMADLNAIVNERKKGMRNLVKSFWRKPKDETSGSGDSSNSYGQSASSAAGAGGDGSSAGVEEVKYRYDSIESQTHLLADTLFLMEDYDNALAMYRLVRDDYKSDKAWVHYGNVLEMIALCMYQLDPYTRAREIFGIFEQALVNYTRAAEEERVRNDTVARQLGEQNIRHTTHKSYITRLASRLSLVLATASDILARGRSLECADLLASVSSYESSLGAAVLMEQSSIFYYKAGMCRKFAFHMLMSGHMFQKAGQNHHAFRCFSSALYIYRNEMWDKLYNHLKTALAAQLYTMGRMSVALVLYAKLIGVTGGGKVSVQSQQKFLEHLLQICETHTKAALAGADRMLVPPCVPRNKREIYRNDRLEQVVHVVQYTKGASRVLELPNVNLPKIPDSSVRLWTMFGSDHLVGETGATAEAEETSDSTFGTPTRGDEKVWEELEITTVAEVSNAGEKDNGGKHNQSEETITAALAKIEDPQHRRFIAEIDKEKQNRSLMERNQRKNPKSKPVVRARGEPIFCDFSMKNTLGVGVKITEIQLVARMVDNSEDNNKMCTNEFAIELGDGDRTDHPKSEWRFACADHLEYTVPDFCRISEAGVKSCLPATSSPFFVVTKQEVELPADGEAVVSTSIAPLVEGDLEILGFRYKLLGKVWLYHSFDIPGPLLKDTRTNIMNKVRGKSVYLKSKIECDMPCLTAELVRRFQPGSPTVDIDDGPMLEGQISTWTIRLRNVGSAPASTVTLKTNLPWIDIVEQEGARSMRDNSNPTSHCVGPSGTLMTLPIEGSIQPNGTLDIPIRVRTSGEKKQDFYMLYRYELEGSEEGQSKRRRSRWLRKMYEIPVYPSLSFSAKPLACYWKGKDLLVSVQLSNNRMDRPTDLYVTLDRLSLTSRRYRLEALPGQFTRSEEFGDVLQIGWQEQVTVFYRVVLPESDTGEETIVSSDCPFSESGCTTTKECASSSATNYLCLANAFASFQSAWKAHQKEIMRIENTPDGEKEHPRSIHSIRRANTTDVRGENDPALAEIENHPTSTGSLCPRSTSASEIHLTCSWRAILGQEVVHGEHHLRGIPIRPLTFFHGCPIAASADHASRMEHDFSENHPARIPIKMTLKNLMLETPVSFLWSWDPPASVRSSLELIGTCQQRLELDADAEITIPLEFLVPKAGVYNLQALRFAVDYPRGTDATDKDVVTHHLSEQWLVHLLDSKAN